jgi:hypothetical protein
MGKREWDFQVDVLLGQPIDRVPTDAVQRLEREAKIDVSDSAWGHIALAVIAELREWRAREAPTAKRIRGLRSAYEEFAETLDYRACFSCKEGGLEPDEYMKPSSEAGGRDEEGNWYCDECSAELAETDLALPLGAEAATVSEEAR